MRATLSPPTLHLQSLQTLSVEGASDPGWSVPEALEAGGGTRLGQAAAPRVDRNAQGEAWEQGHQAGARRHTGGEDGLSGETPGRLALQRMGREEVPPASSCFVSFTSPSC